MVMFSPLWIFDKSWQLTKGIALTPAMDQETITSPEEGRGESKTLKTATTATEIRIPSAEELVEGATDQQCSAFEENIPFHIALTILNRAERCSPVPYIIFDMY
jgi:hypothetical protein